MRLVIVFCLVILYSCRNDNLTESIKEDSNEAKWSGQHSVDFNQEIHTREELDIKIYLEHHKDLTMIQTTSGLRYQIAPNKDERGQKAIEGDLLTVNMKISLIDGRVCFETDSIPEQFVLGHSNRETGLQEGLELMRVNDKAKLILPSYLAHGLMGDLESIPAQSILLIDVELLNIEK